MPTVGGSFSGVLKRGAYDQREREFKRLGGGSENGFYGSRPPYLPLKTRPDVVVFQTEPLEAPVEVVGPIRVTLYASSTAADTDFTVKLVDVYPPSEDFPTGFEMNLTDGILRGRYRNDPSRPGVDDAGGGLRAHHPSRIRPRTVSSPGTASVSTYRAATFRASTSTPTPASPWGGTGARCPPTTRSTTSRPTRPTWYCRWCRWRRSEPRADGPRASTSGTARSTSRRLPPAPPPV